MAKLQLKMLSTQKGSPDGFNVRTYEEGKHYAVPEALAKVFLENEWAEVSEGRVRADEAGDPDLGPDPNPDGPEGAGTENDGTSEPLENLDGKPSTWVGHRLLNEEQEVRTVTNVQGNQVFFAEEDQSYDYRSVRKNFVVAPAE